MDGHEFHLTAAGAPPCKPCCNGRTIGCHGVCEDYKAWKKKVDALREQAQKTAARERKLTVVERRKNRPRSGSPRPFGGGTK